MTSYIKTILAQLKESPYLKAVGTLASGTVLAQLISLVAMPVLTRIYSPDEFGQFSAFWSFYLILSVAACMRLDAAIPVPKHKKIANVLVFLAVLALFSTTLCLAIIAFTLKGQLAELTSIPQNLIFLLPITVFFSGLFNLGQFSATREKQFGNIAKGKIIQALVGSTVQIAMGLKYFGVLGLCLGLAIQQAVSAIYLFVKSGLFTKIFQARTTGRKITKVLSGYADYPKYSTLDTLANSASVHLPIVIFAGVGLVAEAAFLVLAMRVLQLPLTLLGTSVSQVYYSYATEKKRAGKLADFTQKTVLSLVKISLGPFIILAITGEAAAVILFGDEWLKVGELIVWMIPWMFLQFLASPISMVMHVCRRQKLLLALTFSSLLVRVGGLFIMIIVGYDNYIIAYYMLSGAAFYLICLIVFYRIAGANIFILLKKIDVGYLYIAIFAVFVGYFVDFVARNLVLI